jgi:hypothetical protein
LSPAEFERRAQAERDKREAAEKEKEERRMRADEAAIARELEESLKEDERVRVDREKERAKELEREKRRLEAESKSGKKKRKKTEVGMPSGDFFTEFVADEHQEPFRRDLPAVDVCGVEDDYGRVRAAMEHFVDEVIPDIWLSWLWFRRYILSYPMRCDRRCVGCHRPRGDPLVIGGHNWRVTKSELPPGLRNVEMTDDTWRLFNSHVEWFRYIFVDNENVQLVRHGGGAGLGLECTRAASYDLMRERVPGLVYRVSDNF